MSAELLSARLRLRPLGLQDGQALRGDPAVLGGMHKLPRMLDGWVADLLAGESGELTWAVGPRGNRSLNGCLGMLNASLDDDEAELSCWIAPAYRRQGYASEALACIIDYLFEDAQLERLRGSCYRHNRAAARVLEKCGMQLRGTLQGVARPDGQQGDLLLFSLSRADWQARRLGLEPVSGPD